MASRAQESALARRALDASQVSDTTPLRLDVVARLAFPDGSISAASLRGEIAKGRLTSWKIAGKVMTSLAEIKAMVERCRVPASPHASGCAQPRTSEPPHGSSSTDLVSSALAAARMRVQRLNEGSPTISPPSTTRPRNRDNVQPLKP
jgi:hypothetical protein